MSLLLCLPAAAQHSDTPLQPQPDDVQDLILFRPPTMLWVRMHLQVGGVPYQQRWGEYLWELFTSLDKDGDLFLSYNEFKRGPWEQFALRAAGDVRRSQPVDFLALDVSPQDDRVSAEEFLGLLGACACQISAGASQTGDGRQVDFMRILLDHDQDGGITSDEARLAQRLLAQLDADGDGLLSRNELLAGLAARRATVEQTDVGASRDGMLTAMLAPRIDAPWSEAALGLIQAFNRPAMLGESSPNVNRRQFAITDELFAQLDANADELLDQHELAAWLELRQPDIEFVVDLAPKNQHVFEPVAGAAQFERMAYNQFRAVSAAGQDVVVHVNPSHDAGQDNPLDGTDESLFKRLDRDNNEYLDGNELQGVSLARLDADGDGKVFFAEWQVFRAEQRRVAKQRIDIDIQEMEATLFPLIDSQGDARISRRELERLPSLVEQWDRNGDGRFDLSEQPERYQINIRTGADRIQYFGQFVLNASVSTPRREQAVAPAGAPTWFLKMDLNGDGELTRPEFLGTATEFASFDSDADGVITPEEAGAVQTE